MRLGGLAVASGGAPRLVRSYRGPPPRRPWHDLVVPRRRKRPLLEPSALLVELAAADDPPTDLGPFLGQLASAGAIEVYAARRTAEGVLFNISSRDQAGDDEVHVVGRSVRVLASKQIDWQASNTPLRDALGQLVTAVAGYDRLARFHFAASDMELVAGAAAGLIDARDQRGEARFYERVIETGMVVTYARPFLQNQPGLGGSWRPEDAAGRELHDELVALRGEYHAHAEHTRHRGLEFLTTESDRPLMGESWSRLPVEKLRLLQEVAERQAKRFAAEAERIDLEVFGPREA